MCAASRRTGRIRAQVGGARPAPSCALHLAGSGARRRPPPHAAREEKDIFQNREGRLQFSFLPHGSLSFAGHHLCHFEKPRAACGWASPAPTETCGDGCRAGAMPPHARHPCTELPVCTLVRPPLADRLVHTRAQGSRCCRAPGSYAVDRNWTDRPPFGSWSSVKGRCCPPDHSLPCGLT